MIHIDSRVGSRHLHPLIKARGLPVDLCLMDSADAAFSGHGPTGDTPVGIEVKRVEEVTSSTDLRRFLSEQLPKMLAAYQFRVLIVQGGYREAADGTIEKSCQFGQRLVWMRIRSQMTYNRLARTLFTLQLRLGFTVLQTTDDEHTAREITRLYQWFSTPWDEHSSYKITALTDHAEDRNRLLGDPWFERDRHVAVKMIQQVDGIGPTRASAARKYFGSARRMAWAPVSEWRKVEGVDQVMAKRIVEAWRKE